MGCFLTTTKSDLRHFRSQRRASARRRVRQAPPPEVSIVDLIPPSLYSVMLKRTIGKATYEMGKTGEQVAEAVLAQEMGITVTARTNAQGQDLGGHTRGGYTVSVEVKTTMTGRSFEDSLKPAYGYQQCSDGWLEKVGVDPANVRVLGVHIDAEKKTVSIYRRVDSDAKVWKCLVHNAPLSKYNF